MTSPLVTGRLHCIVSVDWGDAVDLEHAARLAKAEVGELPRRPRTPATIAYRPPPLRFPLPPQSLPIEGLSAPGEVEAVVFDFGAANIVFRIPFSLPLDELLRLAPALAKPSWAADAAHSATENLFRDLRPAIENPNRSSLYEEYFVFQIAPHDFFFARGGLASECAAELAPLLRLESAPLAPEEIADALRCRISYGPRDVVLVDWSSAVVIDDDCDETLHTIEFANLQLLEYRFLDQKADDALAAARKEIYFASRSRLPVWRTHTRPLRILSEMRMDAVGTFERAGGALQLVGDQYLARLYRLLADRFHLAEWAQNVRQALEITEDVHKTLSEQGSMYRLELLEITVILLILIEIVMAFAGK